MLPRHDTCIIYPFDPFGRRTGGAEQFIKGFIKYAPEDINIKFIGISSDISKRPAGKWLMASLAKKEFMFYPVLSVKNEIAKPAVPLSLDFTLRLLLKMPDVGNGVLLFNRIEPAVIFGNINLPKMAVIHTDIERHIQKGKSEVLWSKMPFFYKMLEKYVFKMFSSVYAVNKNTVKYYNEIYARDGKKFIPLNTWADTEYFRPGDNGREHVKNALSQRSDKLDPSKKWILYAGRLQEVKAPIRIIESFKKYLNAVPGSVLIIIGEGDMRDEVVRHIKDAGLSDNIFLSGYMDPQELAEFYRAADVFVLASNFEGMPMCVIEALACGTPVVTTNVGSVELVVRPGVSGEIVPTFDAGDIASALEKVAGNPAVYSQANCTSSVERYKPEICLGPLYAKIRELDARNG